MRDRVKELQGRPNVDYNITPQLMVDTTSKASSFLRATHNIMSPKKEFSPIGVGHLPQARYSSGVGAQTNVVLDPGHLASLKDRLAIAKL